MPKETEKPKEQPWLGHDPPPAIRMIKFMKDINNVSQAHKDTHEFQWDGVKPYIKFRSKQALEDGSKPRWKAVFQHEVHYLELDEQ